MSPFSDFSKQFLVAAYLENQRIGDAVESGLIARSYNLKFGPNWIVRVVEGAIKHGWMAGSVNAGGDEYQVIYLTGAGMVEAERLIGQGVEVAWHGVTIEGEVTTIDNTNNSYDRVPASDRVVRITDNQIEAANAKSALSNLYSCLREANDIGGFSPEEIEEARREVWLLEQELLQEVVRIDWIEPLAKACLQWIAVKAAEQIVGALAIAALTALAILFGFSV